MADSVEALSPLPEAAFSGEGIAISRAHGLRRYSLRARDPATLAELTGLPMPGRIGETSGGVARLGPDEFYALLPPERELRLSKAAPASIVDVSSRSVGIVIEGQRAAQVIMSGCPLDMDRMAVGRATRTIYETVEIILFRPDERRFHIEVWRSFAPWLWQSLVEAGLPRLPESAPGSLNIRGS